MSTFASPKSESTRRGLTVTSEPGRILQRKCACGGTPGFGGECAECRKKRGGMLQRQATFETSPSVVPPIIQDVLGSPGQPLDQATRAFLEPRFSEDFSQVRLHTNDQAARSADAINAEAFTVGKDIVFGTAHKGAASNVPTKLLAHELTHVAQQTHSAPPASGLTIDPSPLLESEAAQTAENITQQTPIELSLTPAAPALMRQVAEPKEANLTDEAILGEIASAALAAQAFGSVGSTAPLWKKLDPLWMEGLLKLLERAAKAGTLSVLDGGVDQAQGIFRERLRLAIDAVKIKNKSIPPTALESFAKRLKILPDLQQKEINRFIVGNAPFVVLPSDKNVPLPGSPNFNDFLKSPAAKAAPGTAPPAAQGPGTVEKMLFWNQLFVKGASSSRLPGALSQGWDQVVKNMSSAQSGANFLAGFDIGVPVGAVLDIYSQLKGLVELAIKLYELDSELKAFLIKAAKDPKLIVAEFDKFTAGLLKIVETLLEPEAIGKTIGDAAADKVEVNFLKKTPFYQGIELGEIAGTVVMEIALLFVGVEEVSAVARAAQGTKIGQQIGRSVSESSKVLKALVEAKGLLGKEKLLAKEAEVAGGLAKVEAGVAKGSAASHALAGINEKTAAMLERNPALREALEANPKAASALTLCNSPCIPEFARPDQVKRLNKLVEEAEEAGVKLNQSGMKKFFHKATDAEDLTHLLDDFEAGFRKRIPAGAEIEGGTIFDPNEALESGLKERTAAQAGMFNVHEHHVFPQEFDKELSAARRQVFIDAKVTPEPNYFKNRGVDIHDFCLDVEAALHAAEHGGGSALDVRRRWPGEWNRAIMTKLLERERLLKRPLTAKEIISTGKEFVTADRGIGWKPDRFGRAPKK